MGPIGPYPPGVDTDEQKDEYDRLRRRVLWSLPSGLFVVGSRSGIKRNLMTINWVSQVSFEPKLLAISVEKTAFTHELVNEGQVFALNTVSREDRAIVRTFTKPVEVDPDVTLDEEAMAVVYRVAREALQNVTKHARADHVTVSLAGEDGRTALTVRDDGDGFDPGTVREGHVGLRLLRDLAAEHGADLVIDSVRGVGSTVRLVVPG